MGVGQRLRSVFGDPILVLSIVGLSLFGVAVIYSAGQLEQPQIASAIAWKKQLMWLGISIGLFIIVMRVPVRWLEWLAPILYFLSLGVLVLTLVIGTGAGTAASTRSWIRIGGFAVQPSQFANVATVLMLGRIMGNWRDVPQTVWGLWKPIVITVVPMMLVLAQPDLGTAMVFGGVLIATMFWAGTPMGIMFMLLCPAIGLALAYVATWAYSVYMIGLIVFLYLYRARVSEWALVFGLNIVTGAIAWPLWDKLEPYQKARITSFVDPSTDPQGTGYHVIQSTISIGSGGIFGQGFLRGPQKRLAFIPEQHTDFIYAVIGEELGLIGAGAVLLVYFLILWRLVRLAERLADPFAGIVVFGIAGAWFTHILVNIGMTLGVMPVTGIPLPFLSYSGSFLLATFLALGVAQRVALEQGRI
ncbi:MAG TPA: rod shape-determining protein RodA [Longimicrobiales bacterium]|nr:rod shape-determining protein RodA [Longimicrobiales bacterium]